MVTDSKKPVIGINYSLLASSLVLGLALVACGPSKKNSTQIGIGSRNGVTEMGTTGEHLQQAHQAAFLAQSKVSEIQLSGEIVEQTKAGTDEAEAAPSDAGAENSEATAEVKNDTLYKITVSLPTGADSAIVNYSVSDVSVEELKAETNLQLNMTKDGDSDASESVRAYFLDAELTAILVEVGAGTENSTVYTFLADSENKLVYQYETKLTAQLTASQLIQDLKKIVDEDKISMEQAVGQRKNEIVNPTKPEGTAGTNGREPRADVDDSGLTS